METEVKSGVCDKIGKRRKTSSRFRVGKLIVIILIYLTF